jgi:hypothetical protein
LSNAKPARADIISFLSFNLMQEKCRINVGLMQDFVFNQPSGSHKKGMDL